MGQRAKPIKEEGAISLVGAKSSSHQSSIRPAVRTRVAILVQRCIPESCSCVMEATFYVDSFITL